MQVLSYQTIKKGVSASTISELIGAGRLRRSDVAMVIPARTLERRLSGNQTLKIDEDFARRYVNDGFSGGEKKRAEILQLGMLRPDMAILDETDSGLDVDALRTVAEGIDALRTPDIGGLIITHYQRILNYITPDFVHVLVDGRIVRSGDAELAKQIEAEGYEPLLKEINSMEEVAS